jgi:anti-sigma factor RsiW
LTAEHERFVEDLAADVLESLEAEEYLRVEAHVRTCPTCARLVAEYRAIVGMMPAGLEPATPPHSAWRAIRASARDRRPARRWAPVMAMSNWLRVGTSHFVETKEETVIQVHGVGPWGVTYVNPDDDPNKK